MTPFCCHFFNFEHPWHNINHVSSFQTRDKYLSAANIITDGGVWKSSCFTKGICIWFCSFLDLCSWQKQPFWATKRTDETPLKMESQNRVEMKSAPAFRQVNPGFSCYVIQSSCLVNDFIDLILNSPDSIIKVKPS